MPRQPAAQEAQSPAPRTTRFAKVLILLLWLPASPVAAEGVKASSETLRLAEFFIKTPVSDLPSEYIDLFMAIDEKTLPRKLSRPFQAKKVELHSILQLHKGKKRGNFRVIDEKCETPREATSADIGMLRLAGYVEITEDEKNYLTEKTKCTERDMLCEFTLQIRDESVTVRKKKQVRRRYFLYCDMACDPLMALVGVYRAKARDPNTPFFGAGGGPTCHH